MKIANKTIQIIQSQYFLLFIWFMVTVLLAYSATTPNPRPINPDTYTFEYPLSGVILLSLYYGLFISSYLLVFHVKWFKQHPYVSYLLTSVIAIIFLFLATMLSMHAYGIIACFIFSILLTNLMHFVIYPLIWLFKSSPKHS